MQSRSALFTNELKITGLRDDFRCFRSKMFFHTFSTVPLSTVPLNKPGLYSAGYVVSVSILTSRDLLGLETILERDRSRIDRRA